MKKRADGRYCKNICVGYRPDGKRKFRTIYGKTIKEVEKKEIEIKSQLLADSYIDNDKLTVGSWASEWFETYKANLEYNTVFMYQNAIEKHIIPMIGNIPISQLKTIQIQKMLNQIVEQGKIRTADVCRLTIKQIVKCAYQEQLINRDITIGLQPIKKQEKEKKVLTKGEIIAIEGADLSKKERLFVELLWFTGIRKGEALALTISDIDLKNKKIIINKSVYFEGNTPKTKAPKSKAGNRKVPIPDRLYSILQGYIRIANTFCLFPMTNGEYMSKQSFRVFWDNIIKKTLAIANEINSETGADKNIYPMGDKIEISFTPHTFRHTYATNLYYAGVDVKTAQYLMGHSSINVTLKIYTHLDSKKTDGAIEKINQYFDDQMLVNC